MKPIFKNTIARDFTPVWETAGYLTIRNYKKATSFNQIMNIVEDVNYYNLDWLTIGGITYKFIIYRGAINTFGVRVNGDEPVYEIHLEKVASNIFTHIGNTTLYKSDISNINKFYTTLINWITAVQ
jgi:hypothetical protein